MHDSDCMNVFLELLSKQQAEKLKSRESQKMLVSDVVCVVVVCDVVCDDMDGDEGSCKVE